MLTTIGMLLMIWQYFAVDAFGINSPVGIAWIVGAYVISFLIYRFMVWYRRREGIDVILAYKMIPAE